MKLLDAIASRLPAPKLTATRIVLAFVVALGADALQIALGPIGWFAPDEFIDVVAFIIVTWLIGFHVLLLPTFVVEFVPVLDMLPTWTGCVAAVVALRRNARPQEPPGGAVVEQPPLLPAPSQKSAEAVASPQGDKNSRPV
jgi:hypothetical protein